MVKKWAQEAAKYACLRAYRDPVSKQLIPDSGFVIPQQDFMEWQTQILQRILVGGARTAIMLDAIVKSERTDVDTFSTKSKVVVADPEDPEESEL